MTIHRTIFRALFISVSCCLWLAPPVWAAETGAVASSSGCVLGVTRNSAGTPAPNMKVLIHNVAKSTDRTVTSGESGVFVVQNLEPGHYQLIAANEGLVNPAVTTLDVAAGQTVQADVSAASGLADTTGTVTAKPASSSDSELSSTIEKELAEMRERIALLEAELKARTVQEPSPAAAGVVAPEPALTAMQDTPVAPPQNGSSPGAPPAKEKIAPFSDWDWTWLNGNPRNKDTAFDSKFFTPEIRADITYNYDFNKPADDSEGGSSELFRANELQIEQLGVVSRPAQR